MKRPNSLNIRRAKKAGAGVARTSKEAAMHLVRIEFDIDRLERAITLAEQRANAHRVELALQLAERDKLMTLLTH